MHFIFGLSWMNIAMLHGSTILELNTNVPIFLNVGSSFQFFFFFKNNEKQNIQGDSEQLIS